MSDFYLKFSEYLSYVELKYSFHVTTMCLLWTLQKKTQIKCYTIPKTYPR